MNSYWRLPIFQKKKLHWRKRSQVYRVESITESITTRTENCSCSSLENIEAEMETDIMVISCQEDSLKEKEILDTWRRLCPELRVRSLIEDNVDLGNDNLLYSFADTIKRSTFVLIILSTTILNQFWLRRLQSYLLKRENLIIHDIGHFFNGKLCDDCSWCFFKKNRTDRFYDCINSETYAQTVLSHLYQRPL